MYVSERRSLVLALFARALKPGGHLIIGTHVGDEDAVRTEAYGGVPVHWTTHKWRPELGQDDVAADDDVFDLGCDSLTALRLTGRIEAVLDRVVDVGTVFRCRTARALSHALTP